jgi:hypothetical protein
MPGLVGFTGWPLSGTHVPEVGKCLNLLYKISLPLITKLAKTEQNKRHISLMSTDGKPPNKILTKNSNKNFNE